MSGARNVLLAGAGGGFDVYAALLLRGDETGLDTPAGTEVPFRLVTCFGIDAYHGVVRTQVLENLGALSIPVGSRDAVLFRDAATSLRPSIVQGPIAAALAGSCGDVPFTRRTALRQPVDVLLEARHLHRDRLEMDQVAPRIEAYREEITPRSARGFPH